MFVPQKRIRAFNLIVLASVMVSSGAVFADDVVVPAEVPAANGFHQPAPMLLPPVEPSLPSAVDGPRRIFSSGPMEDYALQPVALQSTEATAADTSEDATAATSTDELKTVHIQQPTSQYFTEPVYTQRSCYTCQQPQASKAWLSFETLLWWTKGSDLPVLATTSPQGTPANEAGILAPNLNTEVLFGGGNIFDFHQGGFRVRGGRWLDRCDGSGFGAEFFMLAPRGTNFDAQSNGNPIIARPFWNAGMNPPQQDSELVSFPGLSNGSFRFSSNTNLYSASLYYTEELFQTGCSCDTCGGCGGCGRSSCSTNCDDGQCMLGIKIGPRFAHLNDTLSMSENWTGVASGNQFRLNDHFNTENSFLGGEIGLRARRQKGDFSLDLGLQLAFGMNRQELDIAGTNSTTNATGTTTDSGGFFAQNSNIGRHERTRFSLVPALELAMGWELDRGWRFTAGYNFMFWANVIRASEQIDSVINEDFFSPPVTPSTGLNRPGVLFHETDYFAHGITVGFEKSW